EKRVESRSHGQGNRRNKQQQRQAWKSLLMQTVSDDLGELTLCRAHWSGAGIMDLFGPTVQHVNFVVVPREGVEVDGDQEKHGVGNSKEREPAKGSQDFPVAPDFRPLLLAGLEILHIFGNCSLM